MTVTYAIMAALAIVLLVLYRKLVRKLENWLFLLYICVAVVNTGYFLLSASKTLGFALLANKIAYLGSVFLPLCMLMTVLKLCRIQPGKGLVGVLLAAGGLMFAVICTTGYLPWYYEQVSLVFVQGGAKLEKVYGFLHPAYLIYLLSYFVAMIATIGYSWKTGRTADSKHAVLLTSIVLSNLLVWFLEKFIPWEFEFLAISYLFSEVFLLCLCWMMQDYVRVDQTRLPEKEQTPVVPEPVPQEPAAEEPVGAEPAPVEIPADPAPVETPAERVLRIANPSDSLTAREREILELMVRGVKRKEIAQTLCLSENTIKTHTRTLYGKLGIGSREELYALLEQ